MYSGLVLWMQGKLVMALVALWGLTRWKIGALISTRLRDLVSTEKRLERSTCHFAIYIAMFRLSCQKPRVKSIQNEK